MVIQLRLYQHLRADIQNFHHLEIEDIKNKTFFIYARFLGSQVRSSEHPIEKQNKILLCSVFCWIGPTKEPKIYGSDTKTYYWA